MSRRFSPADLPLRRRHLAVVRGDSPSPEPRTEPIVTAFNTVESKLELVSETRRRPAYLRLLKPVA